MKRIDCPEIGPRPIDEFTYGGEVRRPPQADADTAALADYVFNRAGAPGVLREWWHHDPSGRWFVLERDTRTDTVLRSIPITEVAHAVPTR
ncbi:sarcosine oxidase subunit delta [Salinisphaera orenii]|uniref:Sarcosine oxidase subunit delta n=1 Tax=Salinisphaera orenii YIM 95161 TaxID=1051139 RepID=A0A423PMM1_9GAMM|nr:sarcosine oxidase subunit delta [Salinisphaera halophila]ROO26856.1 sarcosine oxidase subunit delta [Salinisphaera halophila YIM 95161]